MARARGGKQNFTFVKGWNTEASPMSFPENTAQDLDNVILDIDGALRRRAGVDLENGYTSFGAAASTGVSNKHAIGYFLWDNVASDGDVAIAVTQWGLVLHFHLLNGDDTTGNYIDSVDMTSFVVDSTNAERGLVTALSASGSLYVCGSHINPFRVDYVDSTTVTSTELTLESRDFIGTDIGSLDIDDRPVTADDNHIYNLYNQGWTTARINTFCGNNVITEDASGNITINTYTATNDWPSLADIMYLGVDTDSNGDLLFKRATLVNQTLGNTRAPRGHFILNAFTKNRSVVSGIPVSSATITIRPSSLAFYNGRIFWGVNEPDIGKVYYSQQLTELANAGKCYQEQDPTAEEFNDLVATDGGVVTMPNAGTIVSMIEGPNGVVIFCTKGVWQLTGSGDGTLSATNLQLTKVSDIGIAGAESVVNADGTYLYWSHSGIIALVRDEITGLLSPNNLTQGTIQTGYQLLGAFAIKFARGAFIDEEKKAVWLYNTVTTDGVTDRFKYNGVLILDMQLGAFYKYSISDLTSGNTPYIGGIINAPQLLSGGLTEVVTENAVTVTVNAADVTVTETAVIGTAFQQWKLLIVLDDAGTSSWVCTMGSFKHRGWVDWYSYNGTGESYTSFIETGVELYADPRVDKILPYIFTYMSRVSKSLESGNYYELPAINDQIRTP